MSSYQWVLYVLLTVLCWGVYGNLLHSGSLGMADPQLGRMKAFFWVGIAYFLVAIVGPILYISKSGGTWQMPMQGVGWSLLAGIAGAIGAFGVILALGAAIGAKVQSAPVVVMSLVFAGAPVVAGIHSLLVQPPAGGLKTIDSRFFLGAVLAISGGYLVARYKPAAAPPGAATAEKAVVWAAPAAVAFPVGYTDVTQRDYDVS